MGEFIRTGRVGGIARGPGGDPASGPTGSLFITNIMPGGVRPKLQPAVNRFVLPGWVTVETDQLGAVIGEMIYTLVVVSENTTFIRMVAEVTGGTAGSCRLGIYNYDNGMPGTLVLDAGVIDTEFSATKEITISQNLDPAPYFLASVCDSTATFTIAKGLISHSLPFAGFSESINLLHDRVTLLKTGEVAQVAGGLSDPAVAPDASADVTLTRVALREN